VRLYGVPVLDSPVIIVRGPQSTMFVDGGEASTGAAQDAFQTTVDIPT
jgi:hypothetical protein